MDLTVRQLDNYARGAARAKRNERASMLWAAWNGAVFNGHAFAGKRLPRLEPLMAKVVQDSRPAGDISLAIAHMRLIAKRRGLPQPKARRA